MENVSRWDSTSRSKIRPEEISFVHKNTHIESRSTLEFKHIREIEELKSDPDVEAARIKHKIMFSKFS